MDRGHLPPSDATTVDVGPPSQCDTSVRGPELCIVVPTFNERANIEVLVDWVALALRGIDWEIIFVDDDFHDGTLDIVRRLGLANRRVRGIRRIGRRGLSSAAIEGLLSTSAPFVAVMDGDLQHDEAVLPRMLALLKAGATALVLLAATLRGAELILPGAGTEPRRRAARALADQGRCQGPGQRIFHAAARGRGAGRSATIWRRHEDLDRPPGVVPAPLVAD